MDAKKILEELGDLGCNIGPYLGTTALTFVHTDRGIARGAPKKMRLKKDDIPKLIRLVRQATLLERSGELTADIDRMGKVCGWHIPSNLNS